MSDATSPDTRTEPLPDEPAALSRPRTISLAVFRVLALVTLAAVVVQIAFAGLGAFGASFDPHRALGFIIAVLALLLLVVMLAARPNRAAVLLSVLLVVLAIGQVMLAGLGDETDAWFGAAHAVNALAIMGLTARLAAGARGPVTKRRSAR